MSTVSLKQLTKMDEKFFWPQWRKLSIFIILKAAEEWACLDHTTESQTTQTGVLGQTMLFYRPPWALHNPALKVWFGLNAQTNDRPRVYPQCEPQNFSQLKLQELHLCGMKIYWEPCLRLLKKIFYFLPAVNPIHKSPCSLPSRRKEYYTEAIPEQ